MSDLEDAPTADEANANEQDSGGDAPFRPEWLDGEPDVDRLLRYADNVRSEKATLQERLQAAESVWDDEEEWLKRGEERFPDRFTESSKETDDDDEYDDEDDPRDAELREQAERVRKHDEWIEEQETQAAVRQFKADVDGLAAEQEVELDDDDRTLIYRKGQELGGNKSWGRPELEKAVEWLIERNRKIEQRAIERVKSSKRAPHTPTGGTAGKGPQPDMSTEEGRKQFYEQRLNP